MDGLIQLAASMQWPFAFAAIGMAAAFAVPLIVRTVTRKELERTALNNETEVEKAKIAVSVKNGLAVVAKNDEY